MPRTSAFDLSTLLLASLALGSALIAYWKGPGLPWIGAPIVITSGAGVLTPGGPMVSVPLLVVLARAWRSARSWRT